MLFGLHGSAIALAVAAALCAVAAGAAFFAARRLTVAHDLTLAQAGASPEASMAYGTFATAINCIDGRAQSPVADWLKINCNVSFVDVATIPGPDKALTHGHQERKGHIHEYATISVTAHGSRVIAIAGHHDCAAYPASREEHIATIQQAVKVVSGWQFPVPVRIVGLWVNDLWMVEVVTDTGQKV
jgi:hypothetical protein